MDELHHECGIAAIYHMDGHNDSPLTPPAGADQVSRLMPRVLLDLQNRGQLAAGFTTYNPEREQILDTYKQIGTVIEAFRLNHPAKAESVHGEFAGRAAIGHVRYATCGANTRNYAQPFERQHGCKWKWFSIAFNGQLANFAELRAELLSLADYHLTRETDTEVLMHFIAHALRGDERPDLVEVFRRLEPEVRRRLQLGVPERDGRHGCAPRPDRHSPSVLRPRWPTLRRRQRERSLCTTSVSPRCSRWSRAR